MSHPVWVRGLKHDCDPTQLVAGIGRRTPCGCVD